MADVYEIDEWLIQNVYSQFDNLEDAYYFLVNEQDKIGGGFDHAVESMNSFYSLNYLEVPFFKEEGEWYRGDTGGRVERPTSPWKDSNGHWHNPKTGQFMSFI